MLPISVSRVTHLDAIVFTSAFSNGSIKGGGEDVGRALDFGGTDGTVGAPGAF
jgi:hypothetical protein